MPRRQRPCRDQRGFSLVELLVALLFTALLMAGLASVLRTSVRTFTTTNETLGVQRSNRYALDLISDDLAMAGLVFPERSLPLYVVNGSESLFRVDPDQDVANLARVNDADPTKVTAETLKADVLQLFADVPLNVQATWAQDTPGDVANEDRTSTSPPASAAVNYLKGSASDLAPGDLMIIQDSGEKGNWEHPMISTTISAVGSPIKFEDSNNQNGTYSSDSAVNPYLALGHTAKVPVAFIRPCQLIRLSVQAVALDPSNTSVKVPCLVRQQANYPATVGATVDWSTVPTQVVSENVAGFRVDLSFDGGTTWTRTGSTTWGDMTTKANANLASVGLPGNQSITDTAHPDWFRTISCLIRIDLTTRTAIRREEYNPTPGARAYGTRTQTLMIIPRNFGLGR